MSNRPLSWEDFGAKGDGIADDTAAIQRGLNYAGEVSPDPPGRTYLVYKTGTKQMAFENVLVNVDYSLQIPSNANVSWLGSTVKLANQQNCVALVSAGIGTAQTSGFIWAGGTIDLNGDNQTPASTASIMPNFYFAYCDEITQENITLLNGVHYMGFYSLITRSYINNIRMSKCLGEGLALGFEFGEAKNCFVSNIYAELLAGTLDPFNRPGNPMVIVSEDCVFNNLSSRNCAGAFKIQHNTGSTTMSNIVFDGTVAPGEVDYATNNSGLKVQGQPSITPYVRQLVISGLVCINCGAEGLKFIDQSQDTIVNGFVGVGNGRRLSGSPDIRLSGSRNTITSAVSVDFKDTVNVSVPPPGSGVSIGTLKVSNTAGTAVFNSADGNFVLGELYIEDPNTTMVWPFAVSTSTTGTGGIRNTFSPPPPTGLAPFGIANNNHLFNFGVLQMSPTTALYGSITLADGATTTRLANANLQRTYVGTVTGVDYYLQPTIELIPVTANAKALGYVGYALRDASGAAPQTGADLSHAMTASPSLATYVYKIGSWVITQAFT